MTSLNSLDPKRIRSIDKQTFDALPRHSREQANKETEARDFGFDVEQDLLKAVTGTPLDSSLGKRMSGLDSLHTVVDVELRTLKELLERYLGRFTSKDYQRHFDWVDQVKEVRDKQLLETLDKLMAESLASRRLDKCWLAVPQIIEWSRVDYFAFSEATKALGGHDIRLGNFLDDFKRETKKEADLKAIKNRKAYCFDPDDSVIGAWTIHKCLNCEIDHEGHTYLLSGGKWFQIDSSFVEEVNRFVAGIPSYELSLPVYRDRTETLYNERVKSENDEDFALLDGNWIPFGTKYGKVEFCDLYRRNKDIIHVKRYGGSAVLSHLFAQARVSAELFRHEMRFREKVNAKLPEAHRLLPSATPVRDEYRVVFAIVSESASPVVVLPFFSRVNLRRTVTALTRNRYRVALAKIAVEESHARLRKPRHQIRH